MPNAEREIGNNNKTRKGRRAWPREHAAYAGVTPLSPYAVDCKLKLFQCTSAQAPFGIRPQDSHSLYQMVLASNGNNARSYLKYWS